MHTTPRVITGQLRDCGGSGRVKRRPRRQTGATMIEFAIITPIAILMVLGIVQFGLMFAAKEVINEAVFVAARAGSVNHAIVGNAIDPSTITGAMTKALIPFYQDSSNKDAPSRIADALGKSQSDAAMLQVEVVNPTAQAFDDFGLVSSASQNHRYIPNDNLDYRPHDYIGNASKLSIQDANALEIKVTYGYQIKVPLMQSVIQTIMCGAAASPNCADYYDQGRIPIVAYATVQMQTPAWEPEP